MVPRILAGGALALFLLTGCGEPAGKPAASAGQAAGPAAGAMPGGAPAMTPGLWQMSVSIDGEASPPTRICYDEAIARDFGLFSQQMNDGSCQHSYAPGAGAIQVSSTCKDPDGTTTVTKGSIRGDPSKGYAVDFDQTEGGETSKLKIDAARLGDCPPDFKPGDVEAEGQRMSLLKSGG